MTDPRFHLTCGCCGHQEDLTLAEAFEMGWDTADRFGYTACPLCPGTYVYFPLLHLQKSRAAVDEVHRDQLVEKAAYYTHVHAKAHERWAREGRPAEFIDTVRAGDVPGVNENELQEQIEKVQEWTGKRPPSSS